MLGLFVDLSLRLFTNNIITNFTTVWRYGLSYSTHINIIMVRKRNRKVVWIFVASRRQNCNWRSDVILIVSHSFRLFRREYIIQISNRYNVFVEN